MNRIEKLKSMVKELYEKKEGIRDEAWANWLYENHIFLVSEYAEKFAKKYGAEVDLVISASMLHDVADAIMTRDNPDHEKRSREIALNFLNDCSFSENEIQIIVDDAIKFHGCKNGELPKTLEGKIVASADAVTHLKSDFYDFALRMKGPNESLEDIKTWALSKIERDYNSKIFFDEIRQDTINDYERVKKLFS